MAMRVEEYIEVLLLLIYIYITFTFALLLNPILAKFPLILVGFAKPFHFLSAVRFLLIPCLSSLWLLKPG